MANEYLLKKWKMWFKVLDRKHAGKLTQDDEKRDEDEFVKLAHLEGKRKTEAVKTFHSFWDKFVFHGTTGPVTEEQFLRMTNDDFKKNKETFIKDITNACEEDLKIMDEGGKGYITEEEYIIGNKSLGLEDEAWNKLCFNAFGPVNGKVPIKVILDTWVAFLVGEVSSKNDFMLGVFEKYPDL